MRLSRTQAAVVVIASLLCLRVAVAAVAPLAGSTEGRYAQIAHEMAISGNWITPYLWIDGQHLPFLGKPPLYFWCAALSIRLFGATELAVRLPSLLAAVALVALMWFVLSRYFGRETAWIAVLMTSTSVMFFVLSGSVTVDMLLALFVSGSLLAYLAFAVETDARLKRRWSLTVFVLLAGGFLTKGPVAIVGFGLPVLLWTVLRRRWRLASQHAWLPGILLYLGIVVPWFVVAEIHNPGFLRYFFVNENLLRYVSHDYGDLYGDGRRYPRGAAIAMFAAAALPWSLAGARLVDPRYWSRLRNAMRDDIQLLLFLGFAANVLFWCFARQLLITYMLPMIPLLAAWVACLPPSTRPGFRIVLRCAAASVAVWCLLLAAAVPEISENSTRGILKRASQFASAMNLQPEVVFAESTPSSALFYGRGRVITHMSEGLETTVERVIETDRPRLLIVRRSSLDSLPPRFRRHLRRAARDGPWELLVAGSEVSQLGEVSSIALEPPIGNPAVAVR